MPLWRKALKMVEGHLKEIPIVPPAPAFEVLVVAVTGGIIIGGTLALVE